jgi:hypothetical protein
MPGRAPRLIFSSTLLGAVAIRARCEVCVSADVLALGTLPKTEFKAQRVKDSRREG